MKEGSFLCMFKIEHQQQVHCRENLLWREFRLPNKWSHLLFPNGRKPGSIQDLPKSGWPKVLPRSQYQYIDKKMSKSDELMVSNLMDLMTDHFGRPSCGYSKRTLARTRYNLGWRMGTTRYCQVIREGNKSKRLDWCKKRLAEKELFDGVIFKMSPRYN